VAGFEKWGGPKTLRGESNSGGGGGNWGQGCDKKEEECSVFKRRGGGGEIRERKIKKELVKKKHREKCDP